MLHKLKGNAVYPSVEGPKIICHVCNNKGGWGRGFVLALAKRFPEARSAYRGLETYELGHVQYVKSSSTSDIIIANMIAQDKFRGVHNPVPLRYSALRTCLMEVRDEAFALGASIHMPYIGCGLAGGQWGKVEKLILATMSDVKVYVYEYV